MKHHDWKGQSGDFLGKGSGSSMDFQDHRHYVPGDDPRHINWQAYARSGTYILKQFREEVRPSIDLVLDISGSMFAEPEKTQRCSELLYLIHSIALKNGADIFYHLIAGNHYTPLSPEAISSQQWLHTVKEVVESDYTSAPNLQKIRFRQGSIRVFISDLLFEGDPSPLIQTLAARGGKPIVLVPYLEQEANPSWTGNYDFVDTELGSKHVYKIDHHTLQHYIKQYKKHFSLWREALQQYHISFARVCSNITLFDSLLQDAIPSKAFEMNQT